MMRESPVVLLLMATAILRFPIRISGDLSSDELLDDPPGKNNVFLCRDLIFLNSYYPVK